MKSILKSTLLLSLFISFAARAQNPAVVKQQATLMANAFVKGDYKTLTDFTYPKLIQMMGGREKMISIIITGMAQMKSNGVDFEKVTVGTPGKFYKAGTEIHCLLPETITMKMPTGHITANNNMLAVSNDGGKKWTFLDLNKNTISSIPKLLPNFNHELKIPEPSQPVMSN